MDQIIAAVPVVPVLVCSTSSDGAANANADGTLHAHVASSTPQPPEMPAWALCPITLAVMSDPVSIDCENCRTMQTFDREAVEEWLRRGNQTCPACAATLRSSRLAPNARLGGAIEAEAERIGYEYEYATPTPAELGTEPEPPRFSAMYRWWDSTGVQEAACGALRNLTRPDVFSVAATGESNSGVAAVVFAMRRHGDSAVVQEQACWVLWNILASANNDANRVAVTDVDGISAVVSAMRRHEGTAGAGVQEAACRVLWNLASTRFDGELVTASAGGMPTNVPAPRRLAIARAGGIVAIVSAMRRHKNSVGVQEAACGALRVLSTHDEKNQEAIAEAGGVATIVSAMRRHAKSSEVQAQACWALRNLCCFPSNVPLIRREEPQELLQTLKGVNADFVLMTLWKHEMFADNPTLERSLSTHCIRAAWLKHNRQY